MSSPALPSPVIAIEEHFMHESLSALFPPAAMHQPPAISDRLFDLMGIRITEMDAAGIDRQVLSHQSPGSQRLAPDVAVAACRAANDALAAMIGPAVSFKHCSTCDSFGAVAGLSKLLRCTVFQSRPNSVKLGQPHRSEAMPQSAYKTSAAAITSRKIVPEPSS
jgi:hypothetical protein